MPIGRVVITGSAGRLGGTIADRARARGLEVLGIDRVEGRGETVVADLSDEDAVAAALRPYDLVVHVASMHGFSGAALQQGGLTDQAYLDLNAAGTWHLYNALSAAGVRRVILTSTVGVLGRLPVNRLSTIGVDERFSSVGIYGTTKRFQEDTAQSFAVTSGVSTLAIRPPAFVSIDPVRDVYLLGMGALTLDDVVGIHEAAIAAALDGRILAEPAFEAVFAAPALPYTAKDEALLEAPDGRLSLIETYWPGAREWFAQQGFRPEDGLDIAPYVFDIEPASRLLDWRAEHTFDAWYRANVLR